MGLGWVSATRLTDATGDSDASSAAGSYLKVQNVLWKVGQWVEPGDCDLKKCLQCPRLGTRCLARHYFAWSSKYPVSKIWSPFYRWRNGALGRLNDLPQILQKNSRNGESKKIILTDDFSHPLLKTWKLLTRSITLLISFIVYGQILKTPHFSWDSFPYSPNLLPLFFPISCTEELNWSLHTPYFALFSGKAHCCKWLPC